MPRAGSSTTHVWTSKARMPSTIPTSPKPSARPSSMRHGAAGIPGSDGRSPSIGKWNAGRFHTHIFHVEVRKRIDEIDGAIDRIRIEPVLEEGREESRDDRGSGEAIAPGDRHALLVETGRQAIDEERPVHVVLNVLLARPDDLDGSLDLERDLDGTGDAVDLQAAPEPAAEQMIVHNDLVQGQAGGLCCHRLSPTEYLGADPDFAAILAGVHRAVHRLHCGMGE